MCSRKQRVLSTNFLRSHCHDVTVQHTVICCRVVLSVLSDIMHHGMESAPFFIPSTSFCSLSSWFTSSCAYHLITAITFALTIYHSLGLSLQTQGLKLIAFTNRFLHSHISSTLPSRILTCTELKRHWRFFFVLFLATNRLSFRVHVKLFCRIVSYRNVSSLYAECGPSRKHQVWLGALLFTE